MNDWADDVIKKQRKSNIYDTMVEWCKEQIESGFNKDEAFVMYDEVYIAFGDAGKVLRPVLQMWKQEIFDKVYGNV